MSPIEFIQKWSASELKESAGSQEHFLDLCRMLGVPTPAEADPQGVDYCFEAGASKATGAQGYADVWKRGYFGWEYKGKGKNLDQAFAQLLQYAPALSNPPLLIVSDMDRFVIRTNWTNSVTERYEFSLTDLADPDVRQKLKWAFTDPERLRPGQTRQALTEKAAAKFAKLAQKLRDGGHDPHVVAHFVNRLVFCMFAEDTDLLPGSLFTKMLRACRANPAMSETHASALFAAMHEGGWVGFDAIDHFNGGLFDGGEALPLDAEDVDLCLEAAALDWSDIDPSIFGTMFVRGLDPENRSQTGAEYTDRDKIMSIVGPVIREPILRDWAELRSTLEGAIETARQALESEIASASSFTELDEEVREVRGQIGGKKQLELFPEATKKRLVKSVNQVRSSLRAAAKAYTDAKQDALQRFDAFVSELRGYRVLDPACGSGNFLYVALAELKNIERQVLLEGETLGFGSRFPEIGPECVFGIEINPYAAELARISVWIGQIQWMQKNGFAIGKKPILRPLQNIECRNAIVNVDGSPASWPAAHAIIGNPPYLGAKLMRRRLGSEETDAIRSIYKGRLPGFTDLVCYWFENARAAIESGNSLVAGFVATNSIRKNTNLPVLKRIAESTRIFEAWSEEQWTVEGAAVDVSLVCFGGLDVIPRLNGVPVNIIHPDLTAGLDMTSVRPLAENQNVAFLGIQKSGLLDIPGPLARNWMSQPENPNQRPNSDVLKPYWNGDDVTGRPRDVWFIDLPLGLSKSDASLFQLPFDHVATATYPDGSTTEQKRAALGDRAGPRWWEPHWPRPEMRSKIEALSRYLVTPETAQHRLFTWLSYPTLPDKNLIVIAREDDLIFGLLQNKFHEAWSLRKGSDLEDRPRYTHTTTFATFPFPEGLTPTDPLDLQRQHPAASRIEVAAARLHKLREEWLNPLALIEVVPEQHRATDPNRPIDQQLEFPSRKLPKDTDAAAALATRTLTSLYNDPPQWLLEAHKELDAAVAAAYGWPEDIEIDAALEALVALNTQRGV